MPKKFLHRLDIMSYQTLFLFTAGFFILFFSTFGSLHAQEPAEIVESKGQTVVKIIRATDFDNPDSVSQLRSTMLSVLKPAFDFREFTDRSLGVHADELSDSQISRLHRVFEDYLTSLFMNQFLTSKQLNSLKSIQVVQQDIRGNSARVRAAVDLSSKDKPITVDFIFYKHEDRWIAFNFESEGYSLLSSYRSQFNNILERNSFERLVELIEKKTK